MKIKFSNAKILTMNPDSKEIIEGELWVNDSIIEYVGKSKIAGDSFDQEIDVEGNLLMPGFKNAHSHCPMTFARSLADDMSLSEWLNTKIFPLEAKLTPENVCVYTKLAYMEYLTSGITAAFDMYYEPDAIIKASLETGFRTVLCGAINNFKESPEILEEYYQKYNKCSDMISYKLGFHAEYTTDIGIMEKVAQLAEKYQAPVYVHNSETQEEVSTCIQKYGKTPTELFTDLGLYQYGGGAFHGTYLSEQDMELIKDHKVHVVINSASNTKLASGIAPVTKMIEHDLMLGIGTDGASSNNALDMFREMYLTAVLQKAVQKDPAACSADKMLYMATVGSAKAMGLYDCDCIAAGKKADIIMIDLRQPNMQPINNIVNNLVYSGSKQNVKMTMINGKIVYEDGKFYTIDKDKVYEQANKMLRTLLG
ncbi:amidohydrolase [[Clostridium] polysaccharolyticum]|uniref:5-methylthioadenosine/S-adenosylhomocysteine deaminase n=1 Tax=[Clostridium] polysaccharolyticum TaxID=29364 RepID=A0A1H9ZSW1_9FIRM|nr:amidohydrolase [[Clostridium] polysaccharolyticum]SES84876.1 5-methylthioadenosine/S-adenosylhomocysteine deaminase [[Clostridium] polysaccharolyticum]